MDSRSRKPLLQKRGMGGPPVSSICGRAMRPRSADSLKNDSPPRSQRDAEGEELEFMGYGGNAGVKAGDPASSLESCFLKSCLFCRSDDAASQRRLFTVAGASCSRPSMERPAPCSEWPKHVLLLSGVRLSFAKIETRRRRARVGKRGVFCGSG